MKKIIVLATLLTLILTSGCHDSTTSPTDEFQNVTGTVIKKSTFDLYFIELDTPYQNNIKEVYPENLSDVFEHDSLRVRFSGKITTPPDPPALYISVKLSFIEEVNK